MHVPDDTTQTLGQPRVDLCNHLVRFLVLFDGLIGLVCSAYSFLSGEIMHP